jgi:putative endonuclease
MAAKDDLGRAGEERAAQYLIGAGYDIIERNWRCPQGELDIVALGGTVLVFVEVKTRRSLAYGHPFEAVDVRKRRRLWKLAHAWMAAHPDLAHGRSLRVDVIGITGAEPSTATLEHLVDIV